MIGNAFNRRNLDRWKVVRRAPVMAKEIMAGRDVKVTDFHRDDVTIISVSRLCWDGALANLVLAALLA
jgi:hypothetical protein